MKTIAIVMAGGSGVRLWPSSRESKPKQTLTLFGETTTLQSTVLRMLSVVGADDLYVVTTAPYLDELRAAVPMVPYENILAEPFGRNTAPCVLFAAMVIGQRHPGEELMFVVTPSDHAVSNVEEFRRSIVDAVYLANEYNSIATLGIPPTHPETGYGYIQRGEIIDDPHLPYDTFAASHVQSFAEKPDAETAFRFLRSGDFLWNTGIYVMSDTMLWGSCEEHLPDHYLLMRSLLRAYGRPAWPEVLENTYRQMRSVSIDRGIMENSTRTVVVEGTFGWSDLGSWDELYRLSMKDASDNALSGDVVAIDTKGCYVSTNDRLVALLGTEDLIVVDSDDCLLICQRGRSQDVKEIINFLRRKKMHLYL